jgi:hypothetical protein
MVAAAGVHRLPYRSLLFVPAHDRQRLAAAFASGVDAVVADLEDAVPPDRKDEARRVVADFLPAAGGAARLVRVNPPETGLLDAHLAAIAGLELDASWRGYTRRARSASAARRAPTRRSLRR